MLRASIYRRSFGAGKIPAQAGYTGSGFSPKPTGYSATRCKMYSAPVKCNSKWTTAWVRARFPVFIKCPADPAHFDYFFYKSMRHWICDVPSFNYIFVSVASLVIAFSSLFRHLACNPDVTFRKQERHKPLPDRYRQFSYSLPFYNHRMRNIMIKYKWIFIDNEPDYADEYLPGYRPDRFASHKRPPFWCITNKKYRCDDPMQSACSTYNMEKIYKKEGYKTANLSLNNL